MKHRRIAITATGFVLAVSWVALATSAIGTADGTPRPAEAGNRTYVEPSAQPPPDGDYFGYVRALALQDSAVAVDFISLRDGIVDNIQAEQLVDAGALGEVGLLQPHSESLPDQSSRAASSLRCRAPTTSSTAPLRMASIRDPQSEPSHRCRRDDAIPRSTSRVRTRRVAQVGGRRGAQRDGDRRGRRRAEPSCRDRGRRLGRDGRRRERKRPVAFGLSGLELLDDSLRDAPA